MARLSDHERFVQTLATNTDKVKAVGRLVAACIRQCRSISVIVGRLTQSIEGFYSVKSFTKRELDIQKLVLAFSGPKLAFAICHGLDLPSPSVAQRDAYCIDIRASLAKPTYQEIQGNVSAIHKAGVMWRKGIRPPKRGLSIQSDEIALENRPRYDSRRNSVLGFSRTTADTCDLRVTENTLYAMVDSLKDGTLTVASEATVVAVGAFDGVDYDIFPIMISGTDKKENDMDQAEWLNLLGDVWENSEGGQDSYGFIWTYNSDGDPARRRALHRICLVQQLPPEHPIYPSLHPLPLLNLFVGKRAETVTFDPKHKFKSAH